MDCRFGCALDAYRVHQFTVALEHALVSEALDSVGFVAERVNRFEHFVRIGKAMALGYQLRVYAARFAHFVQVGFGLHRRGFVNLFGYLVPNSVVLLPGIAAQTTLCIFQAVGSQLHVAQRAGLHFGNRLFGRLFP